MKKEAAVGRRISGSQQVNNSLASFRHQNGKIVRIQGLQMHVLTLVANSTLLNLIRRIYRTVLRASIAGMVLTRQMA